MNTTADPEALPRSRKRAVQLTPEAIESLKDALLIKWQGDRRLGKLTRETRAEILGLSVATADRVLSGKGADRSTLILAFRSVDLPWDDDYCAVVQKEAENPVTVPVAAEAPLSPPSPAPASAPPHVSPGFKPGAD